VILEFPDQRLDPFPLSLCMLELWCQPQISCSLPNCLVHVDSKISKCSNGALRFQWARTGARSPRGRYLQVQYS